MIKPPGSSRGALFSGGLQSTIDNPAVTGSCALWGGGVSSLTSTSGTVTGEAALWGNDGTCRK